MCERFLTLAGIEIFIGFKIVIYIMLLYKNHITSEERKIVIPVIINNNRFHIGYIYHWIIK